MWDDPLFAGVPVIPRKFVMLQWATYFGLTVLPGCSFQKSESKYCPERCGRLPDEGQGRWGGVDWPDAAELTKTELESRLFPTEHLPSSVRRSLPDNVFVGV